MDHFAATQSGRGGKEVKTHASGRQKYGRTQKEREGGRGRASPTGFLLRRAPKVLPARDRVTAHYREAIRGGIITQRCEETARAAGGERVYVCALKTKGAFLSTFLSR